MATTLHYYDLGDSPAPRPHKIQLWLGRFGLDENTGSYVKALVEISTAAGVQPAGVVGLLPLTGVRWEGYHDDAPHSQVQVISARIGTPVVEGGDSWSTYAPAASGPSSTSGSVTLRVWVPGGTPEPSEFWTDFVGASESP